MTDSTDFGANDYIEMFQDVDAEWRWRMKAGNHEPIAGSLEGYGDFGWAVRMAHRVGKGVPVFYEGQRLAEDGSVLYEVADAPAEEIVDEDGAPLE
jgi:hypothetical protein